MLGLLISSGSLLVALVIIEVALRLFSASPPQRLFQPNDDFGWMHIPGRDTAYGRINSKGLYDVEHAYVHPPDTYRILLLGDSFFEGLQVPIEATIGRQLEAMLNAHGDRDYQVINGGTSGFGTANELLFYRAEGIKYTPDLVVLGFLFNDLYDNVEMPYFEMKNGEFREARPTPKNVLGPFGELRGWLYDHTYTYGRAATSWKLVTGLVKYGIRGTGVRSPVYLRNTPPEVEEAWGLTDELIGLLDHLVADNGAQLLVVGIAAPSSMFPGSAEPEYDVGLVNRRLGEILAARDIPYVDLLASFREQGEGAYKDLYLSDGHWSTQGHYLAAQVVFHGVVDQESSLLP